LIFTAHYLHAEKVKGVIRVQIIEENVILKSSLTNSGPVNSPVYNLKASRAEVISQRKEIQCWEANLNQADYQISSKRQELEELAKYTEEQASTAS
jgi:hypothetical protein